MNKRKKAVIMILISFSVTTGAAFANTDIGTALTQWYSNKFEKAQEDLDYLLTKYHYIDADNQLQDLKNKVVGESKVGLDKKAATSKFHSIFNIGLHQKTYMDQLEQKLKDVKNNNIKSDFSQYTEEKKFETNKLIDNEARNFLINANEELDTEFNSVIATMKRDTEISSKDSVKELNKQIQDSKEVISDQMTLETLKAEENVKNNLDKEILEQKEKVKENLKIVTDNEIKKIKENSQELENEAQQEMSKVILNITN